jgi:hypothetical protein
MGLSAPFSLLHSDLNEFLFASVGAGENGMPVSVLSALTRLGVDPWEEAARLAALPKARAAAALARLIGGLPLVRSLPSDGDEITAQLVELLPVPGGAVVLGQQRLPVTAAKWTNLALWVACLGLGALALGALW